ncbi:reverse transcriptase domain-containing protein [Pacificispira sp.]|uniref:reverse transcriptase domain-containing protein n=1 Tax=Pacificispira sp. TaxID=2888761 RepID=UPI003B5219EC
MSNSRSPTAYARELLQDSSLALSEGFGIDPERRIYTARKETSKFERRIERAVAVGARGKAIGLQRKYLNSYNARLSALAEANKRLKATQRLPKSDLLILAGCIYASVAGEEPVITWPKIKPSGGRRWVMSFGLLQKAIQILVGRALRPFANLHSYQYATKNGGRPAAVEAVLEAINDGYTHAVELDICNCFGSFDAQKIQEFLPVPREIIETNLVSRSMNLVHRNTGHIHPPGRWIGDCQQGLPQGSSSSPLLAEMLIACVLDQVEVSARLFAYADNILVLARSKRELALTQTTLITAFAQSPVGELRLVPKSDQRRVCDGFEFLGYWFRRRKGKTQVKASQRNYRKLIKACEKRMSKLPKRDGFWRDEVLEQMLRSWFPQFSAWRYAKGAVRSRLLSWVDQRRPDLLPSIQVAYPSVM